MTSRAIEYQREARVAAGGPDIATSPDQFRFDISADITVMRGVSFQPVVQYILNPDSDGLPNSPKLPHSGFIVAALFVLHPNTLLGLNAD